MTKQGYDAKITDSWREIDQERQPVIELNLDGQSQYVRVLDLPEGPVVVAERSAERAFALILDGLDQQQDPLQIQGRIEREFERQQEFQFRDRDGRLHMARVLDVNSREHALALGKMILAQGIEPVLKKIESLKQELRREGSGYGPDIVDRMLDRELEQSLEGPVLELSPLERAQALEARALELAEQLRAPELTPHQREQIRGRFERAMEERRQILLEREQTLDQWERLLELTPEERAQTLERQALEYPEREKVPELTLEELRELIRTEREQIREVKARFLELTPQERVQLCEERVKALESRELTVDGRERLTAELQKAREELMLSINAPERLGPVVELTGEERRRVVDERVREVAEKHLTGPGGTGYDSHEARLERIRQGAEVGLTPQQLEVLLQVDRSQARDIHEMDREQVREYLREQSSRMSRDSPTRTREQGRERTR
jgi:hypothetical protein